MKIKNLCLKKFFFCLLVFLSYSGIILNVYSQTAILGDVDDSGIISITDSLLIARYSAGFTVPIFNIRNADPNCDGVINILDALLIARYTVGLIPKPVCGGNITPTPTRTPMPTPTLLPTPLPTGIGPAYTPPLTSITSNPTPGPSVNPSSSPTEDPHFFYFSYDDSASTAAVELAKYKVNNNQKPDPSLARPWEFLNYEKIIPDTTTKLGVFDVSLGLWERNSLNNGYAKEYKFGAFVSSPVITREERKNAVLTLVLDISGSMSSIATQVDNQPITRMELLKYGLLRMVNSLKDGDVINLITFSTDSWINHQGLLYPRDVNTYLTFISSLQPTNSTNLNSGLMNGYKAALATYDPSKMNRLVLATDAYANTGEINPATISQNIVINGQEGIYFSALGISADVNESFINQLAEAGKGGYYAITTRTDATRAFEERFIALLAVAARDVRFRLDYPLSLTRDQDSTGSEQSSTNPEDVQPTNFSYNTKQYFYEGFFAADLPATATEQFTLTVNYKDPETGVEQTEKITKTVGEILGLDNNCIRDAETIYLFTRLFGLGKSWSAIRTILNTYYEDYSSLLYTEYTGLMKKFIGNALTVLPANLDFGQVAPGKNAVKNLSIINGEAGDIRIMKIYFDNATILAEGMNHTADMPATLGNLDTYDFDIVVNSGISKTYNAILTIETDSIVTPKLTVRCTARVGNPVTPSPTPTPVRTVTPLPAIIY